MVCVIAIPEQNSSLGIVKVTLPAGGTGIPLAGTNVISEGPNGAVVGPVN